MERHGFTGGEVAEGALLELDEELGVSAARSVMEGAAPRTRLPRSSP